MTRQQVALGKRGEEIAEAALRMRGVNLLEKVGTPIRIVGTMRIRGVIWNRVIFGEKVAADWRGVLDNGTSVLAEVKTIYDRNLRWSDLRPHQPKALSDHAQYGVSLLVWVSSQGVFVMKWEIPGFGPSRSISPERAESLDWRNQ